MYGFSNVFCICQNIYCTTSKTHIILLEIGNVDTTRKKQSCEEIVFHEVFSYKPQERYQDERQDATNQNKEGWLK